MASGTTKSSVSEPDERDKSVAGEGKQKLVYIKALPHSETLCISTCQNEISPLPFSTSQPIPLGDAIGISSLRVFSYTENDATPPEVNELMEKLDVVVDPSCANFGERTGLLDGMRGGDVVLYKGDGQDLEGQAVEAMLGYCDEELGGLYAIGQKKDDGQKVENKEAREVGEKLTPTAFGAFFEKFRRRRIKIKANDRDWKDAVNPVTIQRKYDFDVCGGCGVGREPGEELMQCGKCKKQKYCSAECQKKDWKEHKIFCRAL